MLKQIIAAALLSTSLVAGAAAPAFASEDGGEESTFWADRANKAKLTNPDGSSKTVSTTKKKGERKITTRNKKGKVTKVETKTNGSRASITSRMRDGSSTTVTDNGDGTRTITERAPGGEITSQRTVGQTPDHAINHTDGVVSIGIGGGTHLVIGPSGISISN